MSDIVKCINCKHLERDGWCGQTADSPYEHDDRQCDFFQTATNGDRIRRMNDDELAEFLCDMVTRTEGACNECVAYEYCEKGHTGFPDWLKEEVNGKEQGK